MADHNQKHVLLLSLVVISCYISSSFAYQFVVGGRDGWALNPSENYNHWAERNRFQVNDTLLFKYNNGSNSVLVVNKDDYDKCNTGNPLLKLDDGNSIFKFDRSGPFYFIAGNKSSCDQGQKMIIVVLAVRSPPLPPRVPSPTAAPPKASSSPSSSPTAASPLSPSPSTGAPTPANSPSTGAPTPAYSPSTGSPTPANSPSSAGGAPTPAYSPSTVSPAPANSPSSAGGAPTPAYSPSTGYPAPANSPSSAGGAPTPAYSPSTGSPAPANSPSSAGGVPAPANTSPVPSSSVTPGSPGSSTPGAPSTSTPGSGTPADVNAPPPRRPSAAAALGTPSIVLISTVLSVVFGGFMV